MGEIPWQASRRSVVLKKKERGRGKSRHGTETISFCLGAWKAAGGSKKAKDKL